MTGSCVVNAALDKGKHSDKVLDCFSLRDIQKVNK